MEQAAGTTPRPASRPPAGPPPKPPKQPILPPPACPNLLATSTASVTPFASALSSPPPPPPSPAPHSTPSAPPACHGPTVPFFAALPFLPLFPPFTPRRDLLSPFSAALPRETAPELDLPLERASPHKRHVDDEVQSTRAAGTRPLVAKASPRMLPYEDGALASLSTSSPYSRLSRQFLPRSVCSTSEKKEGRQKWSDALSTAAMTPKPNAPPRSVSTGEPPDSGASRRASLAPFWVTFPRVGALAGRRGKGGKSGRNAGGGDASAIGMISTSSPCGNVAVGSSASLSLSAAAATASSALTLPVERGRVRRVSWLVASGGDEAASVRARAHSAPRVSFVPEATHTCAAAS
eukprot:1870574-Pleurochrysis_carterae.AAC.7